MVKGGTEGKEKLLKQRKQSGSPQNWVNVEINGKKEPSHIDWDAVLGRQEIGQ